MVLGDIFGEIVRYLIADVAPGAVGRGLAAHANQKRPGDPPPTSAHFGKAVIALVIIGCAIFCLPTIFIVVRSFEAGSLIVPGWLLVVLGGLAALFLLALWDMLSHRIDWDAKTVRLRSWYSDRTVTWSDIVGLEEKGLTHRLIIRDGARFPFTEGMNGSRHFLSLVRTHLGLQPPAGGPNKRAKRRKRRRKR